MSKVENKNELLSGHRKYYDEEFKRQVIDVWRSGAYTTIVECAKSYNINEYAI